MSLSGQEFSQWHQRRHLNPPAVKRPATSHALLTRIGSLVVMATGKLINATISVYLNEYQLLYCLFDK